MLLHRRMVLFIALSVGFVGAQSATASSRPKPVKVYSGGPGTMLPALLPSNLPLPAVGQCSKHLDGVVSLSVLVDEVGRPHNVMFLNPLGNDLDEIALRLAGMESFTPGTVEGKPAVFGIELKLGLESCYLESDDREGKKTSALTLRSAPVQSIGPLENPPVEAVLIPGDISQQNGPVYKDTWGDDHSTVTPPVPLLRALDYKEDADAGKTGNAGARKTEGKCMVSLVVDAQGFPRKLRIEKGSDRDLDRKSLIVVGRSRFRPATRDGAPVPFFIMVEVNFHLNEPQS